MLRAVCIGFRLHYRYRYRLPKCLCFGSVRIIVTIAWWIDRPILSMDGMRGFGSQYDKALVLCEKGSKFPDLNTVCGDGRGPEITTVVTSYEVSELRRTRKQFFR